GPVHDARERAARPRPPRRATVCAVARGSRTRLDVRDPGVVPPPDGRATGGPFLDSGGVTTSELPPTPPAGAPRPAPPWLIDALLGFAVLDVVAFAIAADVGGGRTDPWLAYPIAVVLGLLVLGRRRFPVGVLVATALVICAYYTLDLPPIGLALPVSVALYSAAVAGRLWWSAGVAAALVVASTYFRL